MTAHSVPVLDIKNLTISLPVGGDRKYAVEDLSLTINRNEIVCIVGESGSGKSVTSFATMGLLPAALRPSSGQILFNGEDLLKLDERHHSALRGRQIAMIFQEPMTALNPCYTVGDQIEEVFAAHTNLGINERKKRCLALIEEVKLPDPERIYNSFPHQLSGGQRQRIVIAIALAMDPPLLIADEPTTALDVTTQAQILAMFKELKSTHNAGIMFVTHDFDVVAEIADRVVVMQAGKVVEHGHAQDVLNQPRHEYTRMLISSVPRRRRDVGVAGSFGDTIMSVKGVRKSFVVPRTFFRPARNVDAVKPVDFELRRGETLGIVGESGSGKSTLVRCIIRLLTPDEGSVLIDGVEFAHLSKKQLRAHRNKIQIVFQDPYGSLNPRRTVGDQLIEGAVNFGKSRIEALERARELLKIVRLDPDAINRYPVQFSGGQRQRICIARALMVDPQILIADEAVSALDVSVQKEVLNLLRDIRDRMGLTMLFITHDLRVAAQVSDEIIVMSKGEVVERGEAAEVFANPKHAYTRQLLDAMPGKGWEVPDFPSVDA